MEVRGHRECRDCGETWSYYETAEVACPACGSIRSVGVDERRRHTDAPVELDLAAARAAVDAGPVAEVAREARDAARAYRRSRGFVHAGELRPLDATYHAACELAHVADVVTRSTAPSDAEEWYLLALVAGAEAGDRPAVDEVPPTLAPARGLAAAEAANDYRRELRAWLSDRKVPGAAEALARLDDHVRRVRALDGDVEPADADRLVAAARDLGDYLREDDPAALEAARGRLDRLG